MTYSTKAAHARAREELTSRRPNDTNLETSTEIAGCFQSCNNLMVVMNYFDIMQDSMFLNGLQRKPRPLGETAPYFNPSAAAR